jgi:MerR family mercuric resistance operon transcriptional regulator
MTISTLADAGGVGVETIRFYQRRGLLDTPSRGAGIRRYGEAELRRLVIEGRESGVTFDDFPYYLRSVAGSLSLSRGAASKLNQKSDLSPSV